MSFNPDPIKPAQEVIYNQQRVQKVSQPWITFNINAWSLCPTERQLAHHNLIGTEIHLGQPNPNGRFYIQNLTWWAD